MLRDHFSYECRGEEVQVDKMKVLYVKGYSVYLCRECCNIPVYHLVRRQLKEEETCSDE